MLWIRICKIRSKWFYVIVIQIRIFFLYWDPNLVRLLNMIWSWYTVLYQFCP